MKDRILALSLIFVLQNKCLLYVCFLFSSSKVWPPVSVSRVVLSWYPIGAEVGHSSKSGRGVL